LFLKEMDIMMPQRPPTVEAPMEVREYPFRGRLVEFYKCYNPHCVDSVDSIMATYSGRHDELMRTLVAKYGPEPTVAGVPLPPHVALSRSRSSSAQPTSSARHGDALQDNIEVVDVARVAALQERITRFYLKHRPDKVSTAAKLAKEHSNDPDAIVSQLVAKYGAEPSTTSEEVNRAIATFMLEHCPDELSGLDTLLGRFIGRESEVLEALVRRFPPKLSSEERAALHVRLQRFYSVYNPERIESIPSILDACRGDSADLIAQLVAKYGPEPLPQERTAARAATLAWPQRFYSMYAYYRPNKVSELGRKLAEHGGREAAWMALLTMKYGEEPPPRTQTDSASAGERRALLGRLQVLFNSYDPTMLPFAECIANDRGMNHKEFFNVMAQRHGLDSTALSSPPRAALPQAQQSGNPLATDLVRRAQEALNPDKTLSEQLHVTQVVDAGLQSPRSPEGVFSAHDGNGAPALSAVVAEYDDVVAALTAALDAKTTELTEQSVLVVKGQEHIRQLEGLVEAKDLQLRQNDDRRAGDDAVRLLHESHVAAQQKATETHTAATSELTAAESEIERLKTTLAMREYQNRMLRMQMQQATDEIGEKEAKIAQALATQQTLSETVHARLREVAALQLEMTPSSDPERFYDVVTELQRSFSDGFDERTRRNESDMREYFAYANQQIENRDSIIEELMRTVEAQMAPPALPELPPADGSDEGLREQVARLQTQLQLQSAEHKTLINAVTLRSKAAALPVPNVELAEEERRDMQAMLHGASTEEHAAVRSLKEQLAGQERDTAAAQSAMTVELLRQTEEVQRLKQQNQQLEGQRPAAPSDAAPSTAAGRNDTNGTSPQKELPRGAAATTSYAMPTTASMWTMMYDADER
jgi:hypothetical protein